MKDLTDMGLWNETMKNTLIAHNGSVQVGVVMFGCALLMYVLCFIF